MDDGSDSSIWRRLARLFHGKHTDTVEQAIREASEEGELDQEEGSMLLSVLELDDLQVRDIMTPRTDIACAPAEATIRQVAELIIATGHSRIPLYRDDRDNIIGIVHAKDLLEHLLDPAEQDHAASSIMRDTFFVPETKNVLDLLHEFRALKNHLAVILDEYGGTAGLVSIEDVLEQIVGDIEDEHDVPRENEITPQADGSCLISGRVYLEDLDEALGLHIESDEVDTLGGYLTHLAGRVPGRGERFTLPESADTPEGVVFTIVNADAKQIHSVRLDRPGAGTQPGLEPETQPEPSSSEQAGQAAQTSQTPQSKDAPDPPACDCAASPPLEPLEGKG